MECGSLQYSLSMSTKPVLIATEPDSPGQGNVLVLSMEGGETAGKTADQGRYAKLRKSTSQSKLMVVAFSLGERCRRVLTKRKSSPQLEIDDPVPVGAEMVDEARLADPVVSQLSRSPSPYLSPRPSSISSARVSYESSFITLSYTESVRSSLSSDLSFWCRGLDSAWDCDFATDNDRQEKLVSTGP